MIVRKMQPYEIDSTILCFNYYKDEAIESLPKILDEYDEDSMVETIRNYASHYDCLWLNAYEGQRVVGFVAGYLSQCPWNKKLVTANIAFIYMLPSHRSFDNFKQLTTAFTEWAKQCECFEMTAGDIGIDIERSQRLYEHLGFKPVLMMSKELNDE